jgi:hypothetical protein
MAATRVAPGIEEGRRMSVMRRFADRVLARIVPEEQAGACQERRCCDGGRVKACYYGCGRPVFCVYEGQCSVGENAPNC